MSTPSEIPGLTPTESGPVPTSLLYYLAGYADGEGCFRYNGTTAVSVINSYPWALQQFQRIWGGSIRKKPNTDPAKHKDVYEWEVTGANARRVAKELEPFLREKRRQAQLVVRIMQYPKKSAERMEMARQLKELKKYEYLLPEGE